MLNISGLKDGVVIDHIQPGGAFEIYNYFNVRQILKRIGNAEKTRRRKNEEVCLQHLWLCS